MASIDQIYEALKTAFNNRVDFITVGPDSDAGLFLIELPNGEQFNIDVTPASAG